MRTSILDVHARVANSLDPLASSAEWDVPSITSPMDLVNASMRIPSVRSICFAIDPAATIAAVSLPEN